MDHPLFRPEAMDSRRNQLYGHVLVNMPVNYALLIVGIGIFVLGMVMFIIFAEYTEKFTVTGYLVSTKPATSLYPKNNGVIAHQYFKQGALVHQGDILFSIDTSLEGLTTHPPQAQAILSQRKRLIEKEIENKKLHLAALKQLQRKNYMSITEFNEKTEALLELENRKSVLDMEVEQYQQEQTHVIRAPMTGLISNIMLKEGQHADASKPLLKMIPQDATLVAELYIPVKKAGFLHKNATALLHYDAYPFERFGSYKGKITEISDNILTDDEEEKPFRIGEPYYKATVVLEKQQVLLYGLKHSIRNGMTFSAVIIGSKRKLWQWILDPLYSYYGSAWA